MQFIDQTEIRVQAGKGGDGMCSFRAARNMPKLGPDGGNGGNGGDVILVAQEGLGTLSNLRYRQSYRADDGGKGGTNNKTGRCAEAKEILVPLGTVVYDIHGKNTIGELLKPKQRLLVAKGGKRGYGNLHFMCATTRAPRKFTHGQKGEELNLRLELKLLADVGLAGFPNAGKSTLLSKISNAKPKIAPYPFTTITPGLGVVELDPFAVDGKGSFVVADIPGLIEGASQGKGLGHDFLKHLERTRIIAYVIDLTGEEDGIAQLAKLRHELQAFSSDLAGKRSLVVINKTDAALSDPEISARFTAVKEALNRENTPYYCISALNGDGLPTLLYALKDFLCKEKEESTSDLRNTNNV